MGLAETIKDLQRQVKILEASLVRGKLTFAQLEVFECLLKGWSNREVAEHLGIKVCSVKSHCSYIYTKYNVTTRAELLVKVSQMMK
jgi:DNA-binding NarL/FixJ family response regulator